MDELILIILQYVSKIPLTETEKKVKSEILIVAVKTPPFLFHSVLEHIFTFNLKKKLDELTTLPFGDNSENMR